MNPTWFTVVDTNMYYTYILLSKNKKFYIGSSNNLRRRIAEHKKKKKDFELIFYEAFKSNKDARRREKYFKTNKGKSTLRQMLRESLKK